MHVIKAAERTLQVAILGAYICGILVGCLGVFLVYLGATGTAEFVFFGQSLKSGNVGIAAIFVGVTSIVIVVRRALKSLDVASRHPMA